MAGKVFFSVKMSLDGFIAPEERIRPRPTHVTTPVPRRWSTGMDRVQTVDP